MKWHLGYDPEMDALHKKVQEAPTEEAAVRIASGMGDDGA